MGIRENEKMVLVSMGGIPDRFKFVRTLKNMPEIHFVIPGGDTRETVIDKNCILLPHHSNFYHPDLVNASDLVLGKAGYSTIAEVFHAGIPFGYFSRTTFREAEILQKYCNEELSGIEFFQSDFENDSWQKKTKSLLSLQKKVRPSVHGADQISDFILQVTG